MLLNIKTSIMKTKLLIFIFLSFTVYLVPGQNPKNTLIERGSSTWCDECICVDSLMQHCVQPAYPNAVLLIYHTNFSAYKIPQCDTISRKVFADHSEIRTNRDGQYYKVYDWKDYHIYCDSVKANISRQKDASVQLSFVSKTYDSQSRQVSVTVKATPYLTSLTGTFLINAVLTENNLYSDQSMDTACYNHFGRRPCNHNDVVRAMAYQYGDIIREGNWHVGEDVTRTFSFTLDDENVPSNCFINIYVYRQADSLLKSEVQQTVVQSVSGPLGDREGGITQVEIMKVFPNPVVGHTSLNLRVIEQTGVSLSIIDMQGRERSLVPARIFSPGIYTIPIETEGFPSGQYIINVVTPDKTYQKTVTILNR